MASHLANSVILVLIWASVVEPNLDWPRWLEGLVWGEALGLVLAGGLVSPMAGLHGRGDGQCTVRADHRSDAWSLGGVDRRRLHGSAMTVPRVAQPVETLHGGGVALSCALDGSISADALHGLFAGDTRVLSTYRITLGGVGLDLLLAEQRGPRHCRVALSERGVPFGVR